VHYRTIYKTGCAECAHNRQTWVYNVESEKSLVLGFVVVLIITGIVIGGVVVSYGSGTSTSKTKTTSKLTPDTDLIDQEREVPDWEFEMSDGSTMKLSDYEGYYVIVDLMSTNCPACESENAYLQEIYDDHGDTIKIVSLSVDLSATPEVMADYKDSRGLPWDVGIDPGFFVQYFNIRYTPTLVVIDPDGYFRMYHEGLWKADDTIEAISLMD